MKITERLLILSLKENLQHLDEVSLTMQKIMKAASKYSKDKDAKTLKDLGNILRNVIEDLRKIKSKLSGKELKSLKSDIGRIERVMNALNIKIPIDKLNPVT